MNERMRELEEQLKYHLKFTRENSQEKVFIVENLLQGRRMLQNLAKTENCLVNIRVETPMSLAREVCMRVLSQVDGYREISSVQAENMIFNILQDVEGERYYGRSQGKTRKVAKALYETFQELTLAKEGKLIQGEKQIFTQTIRDRYEEEKRKDRVLDRGDILSRAIEELEKGKEQRDIKYIYLSTLRLSLLECDFIEKLTDNQGNIIEVTNSKKLEHLTVDNTRFVSCRGSSNELEFPFRDMIEKGYAAEDCAIIYLNPEAVFGLYVNGGKWELPVFVSGGISLKYSNLYTMLYKVFEFGEDDFAYSKMKEILCSGLCRPRSRFRLNRLLERRGIVGGSALYQLEEKQKPDYIETEVFEDWRTFLKLVSEMTRKNISIEEQKENIKLLLAHYSCRNREGERIAYKKILKILDDVVINIQEEKVEQCLLLLLLEAMEDISYKPSNASNGILCMSLEDAAFTSRKYLYILGMSLYGIEDGGTESPILLDYEKIHNIGLLTVEQRSQERIDRFYELLSYYDGQVSFVYNNFDSDKMIEKYPSNFYAQKRNEIKAEEEIITYIPESELTYQDAVIKNSKYIIELKDEDNTEKEQRGECAQEELDIFGDKAKIKNKSHEEWMREFRFSPSSLERAMDCPYSFYLQYLVGIKSVSGLKQKDEEWLKRNIIGTSVHYILEKYYKSPQQQADLNQLIEEEQKRLIATYPCELFKIPVQERELLEIKEMVSEAVNWTENQKRSVLQAEQAFGEENDFRLAIGSHDILIKGEIDRMDQLQDNQYAILDYKTGSTKRFLEQEETHLQFYLYTLAEEQLNKMQNLTIHEAGYLLLEEQIYHSYEMTNEMREKINYKISHLLDILFDEEKIQVVKPCYKLSGNNSLQEGTIEERKQAYEGCKRYCQYAEFCAAKWED